MWLDWSNELSVGVSRIDDQHKELIKLINQFLDALKEGNGRDEILNTLNFLEKYVVIHFNDEEQYMKSINYSGYGEQRVQHEAFKKEVAELKQELSNKGASLTLIISTQKALCSWLKNHIMTYDKKIGKC